MIEPESGFLFRLQEILSNLRQGTLYLARLTAQKVRAKNLQVDKSILVDTISEETAAAGVTIDSLLIKDGAHGQITGTGDLHTEYQKESEKGAASGYMGLDANQYGTDPPQAHVHTGAGSGGALYSVGQYKWAPDAAPGATVTAGDHQGDTYHSGLSAETATRLYVDAETAPGASGLPITIQYGDTNDLDTVASWTTIATLTLSSEKSNYTDSMTNATIPANRVLRMNVGTIVGTPADVTVQLFVKRLLSA